MLIMNGMPLKGKNQYVPRVGIAIGPFNTEASPSNLTYQYNQLVSSDPFENFLKNGLFFSQHKYRRNAVSAY